MRGSLGWEAKVIVLEGPSIKEYENQVKTAQTKCIQVIKNQDSVSQSESSSQKALNQQTQSSNLNNHMSTHDKSVDAASSLLSKQLSVFSSYPEA